MKREPDGKRRCQAASLSGLLVGAESLALLRAARQFVITVREFHAAMVELEAQCDTRIVGGEARQRRLRCWVAMQECERVFAQCRTHSTADD